MTVWDFQPGQEVALADGARVRVTGAGPIHQGRHTVLSVTLNDEERRQRYADGEPDRWFWPEDVKRDDGFKMPVGLKIPCDGCYKPKTRAELVVRGIYAYCQDCDPGEDSET